MVAEGVETVEEWQMLAELGCGFAQGNLIGQAVPGDEVPALIARWRQPEHCDAHRPGQVASPRRPHRGASCRAGMPR